MLSDEFTAPLGWEWRSGNYLTILIPNEWRISREVDNYQAAMKNFFAWLEENDLKAMGYDRTNSWFTVEGSPERYTAQYFYMYVIYPSSEFPYSPDEGVEDIPFTCSCGHEEFTKSSMACHECLK